MKFKIGIEHTFVPDNSTMLRISDLGCAGGVNAIQLLRYIEKILHECNELRPIEYYFEDLPTSDFNELMKTIHNSKLSDQFFPRCIGKSFYEKLFPPNSIHLSLSYITLHWMQKCPGKTQGWNLDMHVYCIVEGPLISRIKNSFKPHRV